MKLGFRTDKNGANPRLAKAGAQIKEVTLPDKFDGMLDAKDRIDEF